MDAPLYAKLARTQRPGRNQAAHGALGDRQVGGDLREREVWRGRGHGSGDPIMYIRGHLIACVESALPVGIDREERIVTIFVFILRCRPDAPTPIVPDREHEHLVIAPTIAVIC